ncbi:GNAT family N-acetyltransferase [Exilibacterium tricleocarpae]|nr:GNAT family N-acetyltransferase [Exilibacterium tricleocarpae]
MEKKSARLSIAPLRRYPQAVALLAGWHQSQERQPGGVAVRRAYEQKLRDHLHPGAVPQTFVACAGGEVIGSVSLVLYRRRTAPAATPWLANLFVREDWRQRGVGATMVRFVQEYARRQEVDRLYLVTTDRAPFYRRRGWEVVRRACWRGRAVDIMSVNL